MTRNPNLLWEAFRPGMSAADLAKTSRHSRTTVIQWLARQTPEKLECRKVGRVDRYYPVRSAAPAPEHTPMQPLRKAFAGPVVIPVREGGRIVPINLNRGYL